MEILKSDLKHGDPQQDISWEDDDLIVHLKEEVICFVRIRPVEIIVQEFETNPKIIIRKPIVVRQ